MNIGALVLTLLMPVFGLGLHKDSDRLSAEDVRSGYVYIKLKHPTDRITLGKTQEFEILHELVDRFQIHEIQGAFPFLERVDPALKGHHIAALEQVYLVGYHAPYLPEVVADAIAADPGIAYSEPIPIYETFGVTMPVVPNDELYGTQFHLDNMSFPEAWEFIKGQDGNVIIAVVDNGHEWMHRDLEQNLWQNPNEIPDNGIDDDNNGFVDDIRGWNFTNNSNDPDHGSGNDHGTAVSGVANAVSDNQVGIAGAAWNAKYMPISAKCQDSTSICSPLDGILYAAIQGAHIVNASFGSFRFSETAYTTLKAVEEMGTLVIAAAGNDRINVDNKPIYPAGYPSTLSVGGIKKRTDENEFNYGRSVNVFAPARRISATAVDGRYGEFGGTSFAVPLVAGVAALVKNRFPSYTPQEIREQIRLSAIGIDDAQDPLTRGLYGRGKADAFRAITLDPLPGIRLDTLIYQDQTGSDQLDQGDRVTIMATFTNYHGSASNASIELMSGVDYIHSFSGPVAVGRLDRGQTRSLDFSFTLGDDSPQSQLLPIYFQITDGNFSDTPDVVRIPINLRATALHQTSALQVSITHEGNVGYNELPLSDTVDGVGFQIKDRQGVLRNPLFEGGLILATDDVRVSDCLRGTVGDFTQEKDLVQTEGTVLNIDSPGAFTTQEGIAIMSDRGAKKPIGLEIIQESYVNDIPEHEDFLILRYTIKNTSQNLISNLHAGLLIDWDVSEDALDYYDFDEERRAGFITDADQSLAVGMRLLTQNAPLRYYTVDNEMDGLYNDFSDYEKWTILSSAIYPNTYLSPPRDLSQLIGSGPHTLEPGDEIEVAIAVIGGTSRDDFYTNADQAQLLWDDVLSQINTSTELETPLDQWLLSPIYPNPASGPINIAFSIPEPGFVTLSVYDMIGREARQIVAGSYASGTHQLMWTPEHLPAGVYMVKLSVEGGTRSAIHRTQAAVITR